MSKAESDPKPHPIAPTIGVGPRIPDQRDECPGSQTADAIDKWALETESPPAVGLQYVRLNENEQLFILFTSTVASVSLHYLDFNDYRGYVHCLGPDCPLCQIGLRVDERDLLPVYSVIDHAVVVLPVPPSKKQLALRPLLFKILRRLGDATAPVLIAISKKQDYSHRATMLGFPPGGDDGVGIITQFLADFDANRVDLGSVFPLHTRETLTAIEAVAIQLQMRGLQR